MADEGDAGGVFGDGGCDVAPRDAENPSLVTVSGGVASGFEVGELLEVCAGTENVRAGDLAVAVLMVVPAQDEIEIVGFGRQAVVVYLALVAEGDDHVGALGPEEGGVFIHGGRGGDEGEVWRQGVDG